MARKRVGNNSRKAIKAKAYRFTPNRRVALKKAQAVSARKRKGMGQKGSVRVTGVRGGVRVAGSGSGKIARSGTRSGTVVSPSGKASRGRRAAVLGAKVGAGVAGVAVAGAGLYGYNKYISLPKYQIKVYEESKARVSANNAFIRDNYFRERLIRTGFGNLNAVLSNRRRSLIMHDGMPRGNINARAGFHPDHINEKGEIAEPKWHGHNKNTLWHKPGEKGLGKFVVGPGGASQTEWRSTTRPRHNNKRRIEYRIRAKSVRRKSSYKRHGPKY